MKKLLQILLLCAVAPAGAGMAIAPGTAAHTHSDANTGGGTLALGGTLSSAKACQSGFVRESPNFCRIVNETAMTWTAGSCQAQTTGTLLPANALSVLLYVVLDAYSTNAIGGPRDFGVAFYNETACTNFIGRARAATWEYVATAAGNLIARTTTTLNIKLTASNTIRASESGAAAGRVFQGIVLGYFD